MYKCPCIVYFSSFWRNFSGENSQIQTGYWDLQITSNVHDLLQGGPTLTNIHINSRPSRQILFENYRKLKRDYYYRYTLYILHSIQVYIACHLPTTLLPIVLLPIRHRRHHIIFLCSSLRDAMMMITTIQMFSLM